MNAVEIEMANFVKEAYGYEGEVRPLLGGLTNSNYVMDQANSPIAIRWYGENSEQERITSEEEALLILDGGATIKTPLFIPAIDGRLRCSFLGRTLSCFTYLNGERRYSLVDAPTNPSVISSMGLALGFIHSKLNPKETSVRQSEAKLVPDRIANLWEFAELGSRLCSDDIPCNIIRASLLAIAGALEKLRLCNESLVRTHGDFHPGNLLFDGESVVAVCDFEHSSWDFRIFDVAMALGVLFSGSPTQSPSAASLSRNFTSSYLEGVETPLSKTEKSVLGPLIILGFLLGVCWAAPRREDPQHGKTVALFYKKLCSAYLQLNELFLTEEFVCALPS